MMFTLYEALDPLDVDSYRIIDIGHVGMYGR